MTKTKFHIAKLLKKFGVHKKEKRLKQGASELLLLRKAESILGRHVWRNIDDIDHYKERYSNMLEMNMKKDEIIQSVNEIESQIEHLQKKKLSEFEQTHNDTDRDLQLMYNTQLGRVDNLKEEQDGITKIAANIRHLHDSAVLKLQSLKADGADDTLISNQEGKLIELKEKFTSLKEKKIEGDKKMAHQLAILKKIETSKCSKQSSYRNDASENYQVVGKAKKTLSTYRSQLGLIDVKLSECYAEIGNQISKERSTITQCRDATKNKAGLCKIIKTLRSSIEYNYELSGR